jgi:hypothetical protein
MTHAGEKRFVPYAAERGVMRDHARRIGRASLLFPVLCMLAAGAPRAAQAETGAASAPAATAASGGTDGAALKTMTEPIPSDEELAARGAVIGDIIIRNENIFDIADPKENNWLFRTANKIHAKTRPWLIRKQLLFRAGDRYDRRILDESERILRLNRYFYDARIRPVAFHDGRVDVEVLTRDVWTLNPGISFKRQGGANTTSINFEELNLLGTGVGVSFSHASNPDRNTDSVLLDSTHIGGTWLRTELLFAENSDGRKRSVLIERPFYSLETRWAAGANFVDDLRVDTLFGREGVAGRFQTHAKRLNAFGGWSGGLKGRWVKRFTFGFNKDESRFAPAAGDVPSDPVPPDRLLAYPWVGFELVEDAFEKAKNRDQIERTEDFFLGTLFRASLGYASDGFGADREAVVFSGRFATSFQATESSTLLMDSAGGGRVEGGTVRDTTLGAGGRLYVRLSESWLLFSLLSASRGVHLDPDHELVLGGENGLRGYPRRYQAGDRTALFVLEARYYTSLYPFRLFRVGGAVFCDAGRAWGGDFAKASDPGILRDIGVGIRLGVTRSGLGNVIHIDMAFPLDGDPTISPVQFLVTTKQSF